VRTIASISMLVFLACALQAEEQTFSKENVEKTIQNRTGLVKKALEFLQNKENDNYDRCHAAQLLGEYCAKEAIATLLDNIDSLSNKGPWETEDPIKRYVCVPALIKIGKDVVKPCLATLATKDCSEVEIGFIVYVLESVEKNIQIIEAIIAEFPEAQQKSAKKILLEYRKNWGKNLTDETVNVPDTKPTQNVTQETFAPPKDVKEAPPKSTAPSDSKDVPRKTTAPVEPKSITPPEK